jgi:hypothetical protein
MLRWFYPNSVVTHWNEQLLMLPNTDQEGAFDAMVNLLRRAQSQPTRGWPVEPVQYPGVPQGSDLVDVWFFRSQTRSPRGLNPRVEIVYRVFEEKFMGCDVWLADLTIMR